MPQKVTVSIIGAAGYTGLELLRLLVNHPNVAVKHLVSHSHHGQKISDVWPHLRNICDITLENVELKEVATTSDVVFLALPHHETQQMMKGVTSAAKIIDLSADFRVKNGALYEKYYGHPHQDPENLKEFVYGLPEASREQIVSARKIANPGCFAIVSELALLPLKEMISHASLVAVTGSSGSGKSPREESHHPIRNHNLASYKIGAHQHIPEIIQALDIDEAQITLVPTSGPFTRGIHLTGFVDTKSSLSEEKIRALYEETFQHAPFIRLKKNVQLTEVVGSNFCDLSLNFIHNKLVIQGVIDNLVKGAAGNAIQNMNLMCGFEEGAGLSHVSPLFP